MHGRGQSGVFALYRFGEQTVNNIKKQSRDSGSAFCVERYSVFGGSFQLCEGRHEFLCADGFKCYLVKHIGSHFARRHNDSLAECGVSDLITDLEALERLVSRGCAEGGLCEEFL